MTETKLSLPIIRLLLLSAQGLLHPPTHPANKADILDTIRQLGALQIDTINIVARAPYFILFSRLGNYNPAWLEEHLQEGHLFEYWSHAASFLPIEDYPLYRYRMADGFHRYYSSEWRDQYSQTIETVMARIRGNGPVRSSDFERSDGKKGTWWDWKEEKRVLEFLHTTGQLMIARRVNFQRIYDLQERVLPGFDESCALSAEAAQDELSVRAVRSLGLPPARWVPDYFRLPKAGMVNRLERLAGQGRIQKFSVEGWQDPVYLHPDNLPVLKAALRGEVQADHTSLLSPFDPLVWDRARSRELFDFDYSIECYLPKPKRRYGYFVLPILHRDRLIGRLDAKAHRKEGLFEVISIHLEPGIELTQELTTDISRAIQRCADWHKTPQVEVRHTMPETLKKMLLHL